MLALNTAETKTFKGRLAVKNMTADTIYALSSGRGRAGIAIVRLSGPKAWPVAEALIGQQPKDRRAIRCRLRDPNSNETLDIALCLGFVGPNSYTGEDVVELHIHGGLAVIDGLLDVLANILGLRLAEPGEFTRRAFENNIIDLTGAEAIGDLIDAETIAQRRQALRQGSGVLAKRCENWRALLVSALAYWEATLDFADEEMPDELEANTHKKIIQLTEDILEALDDDRVGERLRDGLRLAIIGPPNAGKSSIFNVLAARDVAIVANTAGTTRDVLEVHLDLGGYPIIAADTAGLREGGEGIEQEGIRRARHQAQEADLKLAVFDVADWPDGWRPFSDLIDDTCLIAVNKTDLKSRSLGREPVGAKVFSVSAKTGAGITVLIEAIQKAAAQKMGTGADPIITRARHREALQDCLAALQAFSSCSEWRERPEIAGEHLRIAARALGRVTGRVDVEELLDVIFRDFCIGK